VIKFIATDYFSGEGELFVPALVKIFTGKRPESHLKVLTVSDLERGIIFARLDEEIINGNNGLIWNISSKFG
jgi:hypothetical protein